MLRQWDERFIEWPRNCFSFREGFNLSTCQFFRRQKYTQSYIHVYLRGFKINRKVAWQRIQKSMRSIEERVIPLSSCSIFMVFYGHHWDIEKQESSVIIIRIFSYINHSKHRWTTSKLKELRNFTYTTFLKFIAKSAYGKYAKHESSTSIFLKVGWHGILNPFIDNCRQFSNSMTNVSFNIRACIWIIRNVRIFTNVW